MSTSASRPSVADDLLAFIQASPTPFHAVAEARRRLEAQGYRPLNEAESWSVEPGARVYVVRSDSSLAAFRMGSVPPAQGGFRLVGAHTDSPNLRLKPRSAYTKAAVHQLGVEIYGGVLLHTWLDRDLSLAGRVLVRRGQGTEHHLVDFARPLLRVPSLAIHLNRQVNTDGLKLNAQEHLVPMFALESEGPFDLHAFVAAELARNGVAVEAADIVGLDLSLYDAQPPSRSGRNGEFLHAPRLDNLCSSHAGLTALLDAPAGGEATLGVVLYDHEEVGSRSAQGAGGTLLKDCLSRLSIGAESTPRGDEVQRAVARSWLISADMAHALHPNYAERHEPRHQPLLGGGPVLKTNVNQSYATDGEGQALFTGLCREAGVPMQDFVTRTDLPCGGTIGPISAAGLGLRTVDVGGPMLSMHSIRELCAAKDVEAMVAVLRCWFV